MSERTKRIVRTYRHRSKYSCQEIFRLLCPVKENDWIPGWRDQWEMVYTKSGFAEPGCVFKTKNQPHLMEPAIWVNNVYEPFSKIQYSAVNHSIVYQIAFDLKPTHDGSEVVMTRQWTALTVEAEEFLGELEAGVGTQPPQLFLLIDHYLATGKMTGT